MQLTTTQNHAKNIKSTTCLAIILMKYKMVGLYSYFHVLERDFHCFRVLVLQKGKILLFMNWYREKIFWGILIE